MLHEVRQDGRKGARPINFMKLYIGDYLRDTGTLTLSQHGAYHLMLLEFYATEKPLPKGRELHRLLRADSKTEREAIDFIASKFWTESDIGLTNHRGQLEIERASHQRTVNREIGKRGGRPRQTDSVIEKETERITDSVTESKPNRNPPQTPDTRLNSNTPPTPRKRRVVFDAKQKTELPPWLPAELWAMWCDDREARGKPISEQGARQQLEKLGEFRSQGMSPKAVIDHSIAGGYQGLFAPPKQSVNGQHEPAPWFETRAGVERMALSIGLKKHVESEEQFPVYKARVMHAAKAAMPVSGLDLGQLEKLVKEKNHEPV